MYHSFLLALLQTIVQLNRKFVNRRKMAVKQTGTPKKLHKAIIPAYSAGVDRLKHLNV